MTIRVDDVKIKDEEVFAEMQYQTEAHSLEEACFFAARSLVIRQLLLTEALDKETVSSLKNKSLDALSQDEEEQLIDSLIDVSVSIPPLDEAICQNYYNNNNNKFKDKEADKTLPFDQVFEHIKEYLSSQSLMTGISEYIQSLAAKANIKGFDFKDPQAMTIDLSGMKESGS